MRAPGEKGGPCIYVCISPFVCCGRNRSRRTAAKTQRCEKKHLRELTFTRTREHLPPERDARCTTRYFTPRHTRCAYIWMCVYNSCYYASAVSGTVCRCPIIIVEKRETRAEIFEEVYVPLNSLATHLKLLSAIRRDFYFFIKADFADFFDTIFRAVFMILYDLFYDYHL